MQSPYIFQNLELITGGDPKLAIDVLETFLTVSRASIAALQDAHRENDHDSWRHETHTLKGSCFNIGADGLGEICEMAESQANAAINTRSEILHNIENEFARLEQAIFHFVQEKQRQNNLPA